MCLSDEIAVVMICPLGDVFIIVSKLNVFKFKRLNVNAPYIFALDLYPIASYQRTFVFSREYGSNTKNEQSSHHAIPKISPPHW